jgi:hypothetical protein
MTIQSDRHSVRSAFFSLVAATSVAAIAACSGSVVSTPLDPAYGPTQPNTSYDGKSCAWPNSKKAIGVGESFPSPDGCNACLCTDKGIACTMKSCGGIEYCVADGIAHKVGDTWGGGGGTGGSFGGTAMPAGDPAAPSLVQSICGQTSSSSTSGSSGASNGSTSGSSSGYSCECKAGGVVTCSSWTSGSTGSASSTSGSASSSGSTQRPAPPPPDPSSSSGSTSGSTTSGSNSTTGGIIPAGDCVCLKQDGTSVPVFSSYSDGCNTCSCTPSGLSCTERACAPGTCKYNGAVYKDGESFPAGDGCNTCSCASKGGMESVACTKIACPTPGK